ncbi:hypothetical protein TEA_027971 [Camellia sinensis var. sinensis]|uniref:XS domain-containing protein n=1 Tax=Camellia sinensis var. sinensis TaxID=542762 RepID=A0A4S4EIA8_CAMSN|nr:hypothetical protein TEA_027971 [Camellia sinensis var. sinensis]
MRLELTLSKEITVGNPEKFGENFSGQWEVQINLKRSPEKFGIREREREGEREREREGEGMGRGNHSKGKGSSHNPSSSSSNPKSRWHSAINHPSSATKPSISADSNPPPPPPPKPSSNLTNNDPTPKPAPSPTPNLSGAPFPFPDDIGPPPPPAYGFHMLERRSIVLADSNVRSYLALPPDYQNFKPAVHLGPELAGPGRGFDTRFPPMGPMSPEFRDRDEIFMLDRNQGYWNSLGPMKRKYGDDEREGKDGNDEFERQRQQLLQHGDVGLNQNRYMMMGLSDRGEFLAGTSNPRGNELSAAKYMRVGDGGHENMHNVGFKHNDIVDEGALKKSFLHFVKLVYSNESQKKNYLENGRQAPLQCVACGRAFEKLLDARGGMNRRRYNIVVKLRRRKLRVMKMRKQRKKSFWYVFVASHCSVVGILIASPEREQEQGHKSILCENISRTGVPLGSSKDFPDMHNLIMHTYNSDTADLLVDHLGLHKALCVLMGWNYLKSPDNSKAYQSLSSNEASANQDDLIIWPPVVIIHNTNTGKGRDGRKEGLGNKEMDNKLREFEDMHTSTILDWPGISARPDPKLWIRDYFGFRGGKSKSMYGIDGHLGITLVKFYGNQSGLKEAVRLAEFFEKESHGRIGWTRAESLKSGRDDENNPNLMKVDVKTGEKKRIFYGYLVTVFDLDKVDFETRKKAVIESRREYKPSA